MTIRAGVGVSTKRNPKAAGKEAAKKALKAPELKLRASEIKFRELVSRSLVGIFQTTPEGIVLEANPVILKALGFESIEQLNQVGLANLYANADDRQRFVSAVSRGPVSNIEIRLRRADGRIIDVSLSGNLVHDDSGKLRFIEGTFEDITEHKKAEEARREAEGKFKTLVENLNVGVYRNTAGPQGRFLHANPAISRIFGYDSVESFMQVPVADTYQNAEERKMFIAEISEKGSVRDKVLHLHRKDGIPFWASLTATARVVACSWWCARAAIAGRFIAQAGVRPRRGGRPSVGPVRAISPVVRGDLRMPNARDDIGRAARS